MWMNVKPGSQEMIISGPLISPDIRKVPRSEIPELIFTAWGILGPDIVL
jgi:hypothetical protein